MVLSLACAGGVKDESNTSGPRPQLSLDEYFHELSTAFDRLEEAAERSAQPPDPRSVGAPEELLRLFQDSITGLESSTAAFIGEVEALKPPVETSDAHQEFLEALRSDYERISALASAPRVGSVVANLRARRA